MAKVIPITGDQRIYGTKDGSRKAEIDLCITDEQPDEPSVAECRHGVLHLDLSQQPVSKSKSNGAGGYQPNKDGYVVYDRLLQRVINGVFSNPDDALRVAWRYNTRLDGSQDMAPNGFAMGLIYPKKEDYQEDLYTE